MPTNPYSIANLPNADPRLLRILRDMVDRTNALEDEMEKMKSIPPQLLNLAKKENPVEGIITIPSSGGDGFIRVSKDGAIVSYTNPIDSIFPYLDLSIAGNVTTGLDQLHSFTLPANTLANDGDSLWIRYGGVFATNDNDKRIQTEFDGVATHNTGLFDQDSGKWMYDFLYTRINSVTIKAPFIVHWGNGNRNGLGTLGGNYVFAGDFIGITVSNLNTTNVVIRLLAEGTATDDIVQGYSFIDLMRSKTVKLV